ncbi:MAG: PLP-dependent aminotransferase family protein [Acetobacteraceae bacterium]
MCKTRQTALRGSMGSTATPEGWLTLDRAAGDLEGQVHRAVRERILSGTLAAGQRLPSTRALAATLGIARSTVVQAYERLLAEGFLDAATGSATRVAILPGPPRTARRPGGRAATAATARVVSPEPAPGGALQSGVPDLEGFPHAQWARCLGARARALRVHDLGYGATSGIAELRAAILAHVSATRGVNAVADQVVVVPSTGAAIDLIARLLLRLDVRGGDPAWIEDPGYPAAQALLRAAGARLVPVPCDAEGIDVAKASGPPPRLVYVTPSHQYPTGATMSLPRRLALLEAAQAWGAVVLEDDYDSEFQYGSRPIAALQGIDRGGSVAYLGTFSKVLAPGLRVAYAILPPHLLPEVTVAQRLRGAVVPVHVQAALADFLRDGYLRAHIRRIGASYAVRMAATVRALERHCGDVLSVEDGAGGLQLAAWFHDPGTDDRTAARMLQQKGFGVRALSDFYIGSPRPGLLFGIARSLPEQADGAVLRIRRVLDMSRMP